MEIEILIGRWSHCEVIPEMAGRGLLGICLASLICSGLAFQGYEGPKKGSGCIFAKFGRRNRWDKSHAHACHAPSILTITVNILECWCGTHLGAELFCKECASDVQRIERWHFVKSSYVVAFSHGCRESACRTVPGLLHEKSTFSSLASVGNEPFTHALGRQFGLYIL